MGARALKIGHRFAVMVTTSIENLSRVQQSGWVQGTLDGARHIHRRAAELMFEEHLFSDADAMFARARAIHVDCSPREPLMKPFDLRHFNCVVRIDATAGLRSAVYKGTVRK
ncbi:hypothetical protein [Povalibacter sp.]|uniref:hypothetical protein n=1 Tax=Povalibacter sp. TaxID=1962978 RepID=UPI002F42B742